jgi:hypothetical protein
MSFNEAVIALDSCTKDIDSRVSRGQTQDGKSFYKFRFSDTPPLSEIKSCELSVLTGEGALLEVDLVPGGTVTRKRYTPSDPPVEWLLIHLCRIFDL